MKFLIILFTFLSFGSSFAECLQPKHHIFLIHGISGGKKTFGSLETILNRQDPCQKAWSFEYRTGSHLTPYDFARDFDQYIQGMKAQHIGPMDKISLVMHSQGGLVGSLWLKHLINSNHPMMNQVESFVTLSTPFWGTNIAQVGKTLFHSLPPGISNPIIKFGKNELNEMTYGSGLVQDMAQNMDLIYSKIPKLRPLMIAGLRKLHSRHLGEDDVVVPLHSMRPSKKYLKDDVSFFDKPHHVPASSFTKSNDYPFVIVPADHIKIFQSGVAEIPLNCVQNLNCGHPSLKYILDHLKGNKVESVGHNLSRFRVTMYVNNPLKSDYDPKELTISIKAADNYAQVPAIERFHTKASAKLENSFAFSFTGFAKKPGEQKIFVTLKYRNKIIKTYEVPVEAGTSSFIDMNLTAAN